MRGGRWGNAAWEDAWVGIDLLLWPQERGCLSLLWGGDDGGGSSMVELGGVGGSGASLSAELPTGVSSQVKPTALVQPAVERDWREAWMERKTEEPLFL